MNTAEFTAKVKAYAKELGADLVGIAPISRYKGAPEMLRPQAHLPEAQSVVVMAVHHTDASVEWGAEPNSNYPGAFQIGMIPKLDTISLRMARFLEHNGFSANPFAATYYWHHRHHPKVKYDHAASFSHMNAFVAAGLGEYGWHGMVMSPEYGPRQRIVSIITSAKLAPDPLYNGEPLCDHCKLCEKACWGANYEPKKLLEPATIKFEIEGKKIEYANVNRWRCFWGEQCHLDMNELSKIDQLDEEKLLNVIDEGAVRINQGSAGYMCSSFKHCMAKPVRKWDKKISPGPRRRKETIDIAPEAIIDKIKEIAVKAGGHKLSILPLKDFETVKDQFYDGFRTDQMFEEFEWVITINRKIAPYKTFDSSLLQNNHQLCWTFNKTAQMLGAMDIANYIDDLGLYSFVSWFSTGVHLKAAELSGWISANEEYVTADNMSIICKGPLNKLICDFPQKYFANDNDLISEVLENNPHVDIIEAEALAEMDFPEADKLRKSIPEGKSLIAIGVELPARVVELAGKQEADCGMSYQYVNQAAQKEAFWAAQDISSKLEADGHYSICLQNLDENSVGRHGAYGALTDIRSQSSFAAAAGAGYLGKSGMVITEKFGPRVRFAFVVTSADIKTETKEIAAECPADCKKCLDECSMSALEGDNMEEVKVNSQNTYSVYKRDEHKCRWARVHGLCKEEGGELTGWKIPDNLKYPGELSAEEMDEFLKKHKDPIIVKCYQNANHSPTQIERCLQACIKN